MTDGVLTIAEQVRERLHELTATERKAAHVLLATYPLAGLEPVADFAARAGVSAPSILRFVARVGFQSYPDFQRRLRDELEAQLKTPLMKASFDPAAAGGKSRLFEQFKVAVENNIAETFAHVPPGEFDAIVALMSDPRRRIYMIGGRFTDPLARYLASHLRIVRTRVIHLSGQIENLRDQVLDMRKNDVLVVFDMRRYQSDIVALARLAEGRGVKIVLITDQWLSPISQAATHMLSAHISVPSNWDSNVAPMALVEALLAAVTERIWPSAKTRITEIEKLRPSD
jgi:DNA-binding MurR/RpiR family transcriptional regulator